MFSLWGCYYDLSKNRQVLIVVHLSFEIVTVVGSLYIFQLSKKRRNERELGIIDTVTIFVKMVTSKILH